MLGSKKYRENNPDLDVSAKRRFKHAVRWVSGWTFIGLGIIGLFLPILQGILFIVIGLVLLAPYVPLFRKIRIRILLRFPRLRLRLLAHKERRREKRRRQTLENVKDD